jgi:hypothetical protein
MPTLRPAKRVNFEKAPVVHHRGDELLHVVRLARVFGDEGVEGWILAVGRIRGRVSRGFLEVVRWEVRHEIADEEEAGSIVVGREVGNAGTGVVGHGPAQVFLRDLLVSDGLDDVRSGDEHVRRVLHHQIEICGITPEARVLRKKMSA